MKNLDNVASVLRVSKKIQVTILCALLVFAFGESMAVDSTKDLFGGSNAKGIIAENTGNFESEEGCLTCNNVTNAGSIGTNQSGCSGYDPAEITNIASPTGGSGALELIWVYWNASTNWNLTTIGGATSLTYNPGPVTEDTYFRRCSRRAGCSDYVGESNDVFVDIVTCSTCNGSIGSVVLYNLTSGSNHTTLTNNAVYSIGSLPASWNVEALLSGTDAESVKFTWTGSYVANNTENTIPFRSPTDLVELNLGVGSYTLNVKLYNQDNLGGTMCDEETYYFSIIDDCDNVTFGGLIGEDLSGCGTIDPPAFTNLCDPSGGSGALEIIWIYKSASTGWNWVMIPGANDLTYDAGPVSETTVFRRCARRNPCEDYLGESNEVTITITGDCCFYNVYDEQFNYDNGTTNTSNFSTSYGGSHTFSVQNNKFKASDTDEEGVWTSTSINIAGQGAACISIDLSEEGTLESGDYVKVYYKLNGGSEVLITNIADDFTSTTVSQCGLTGNSLQIIIKIKNSAGDEKHYIDNVQVEVEGECTPLEICLIDGYEYAGGRIFWIPGYGTDFKSSASDPLKLTKYSGGIAHLSGTIERIADTNQKFVVSIWFDNQSTYAEWIAQGNQAHSPNLGDESTWTFYDFDTNHSHTLVGQGSLAGTTLFLVNQMDIYGLQLGNGANSLNVNNNGISTWFSYTGTTSGTGDINGSYDCGDCTLDVNAGPDQDISCLPGSQTELTATVTGAEICETPSVSDCNHALGITGGWLENANASTICGDNAGTKLWTQSGGTNGTSFITIDFGVEVPAGTQICVNMKLEHCSNSSTGYSDAKIQASTQPASAFANLTSSVTFSQTTYEDFCYTLGTAARYIKISDNGYCAFRVDFVEYTIPGSGDGGVTYEWSGPGIVGANNGPSVMVGEAGTYIVTVYDCGNCSASDTVVVTGTTCGTIVFHNIPADVTAQCDEIPGLPANVYASNDCESYIVVSYNQLVNGSGCSYSITRTWTAIDNCGYTTSDSYIISVIDLTAPIIHGVPDDVTATCDNVPGIPTGIYATDNCDENVQVYYTEEIIPGEPVMVGGPPCGYTIIRRWTATDDCYNTTVETQTVVVYDNEAPILIGVPGNVTVECDEIPAPPVVTAQDNCWDGTMEVLMNENIIWISDCVYQLIRTWVVEDNCWNYNSQSQIITVTDYTAPVLSGEDVEATFQCNIIPSIIAPTATDNCDDDVLIVPGQITIPGDCENEYTWVLTWTAYDNCGNSSVRTYIFHFEDTTPPVIYGVPDNTTIECDEEVPNAVVWATDNCDPEVMVSLDAQTYPLDCGYLFVRTWTAVDNCGNTSVAQQTITVVDYTAPVLHGLPDNVTAECDNIPGAVVVTASDNCDPYVPVSYSTWQTEGCPYYIYRTWTASDDCGNTTTHTQTIYVVDTEAPVILNPPTDIEVECDEEVPAYVPQWTDNCDTDLELQALSSIGFDDCYTWIHQTYIAIDNCGNQTSVVRNINIVDTTPPVFNPYEPYIQVACGTDIIPCNLTATDNCDDDVTITMTDEVVFSGGCYGNIFRTCTATDECGNTATATQIIFYLDFEAPVLHGVPGDTTVECDDDLPAVPTVTATDNCDDELVVEYDQDIQVITDCITLVIRTWYVIDDCGNETTATQTITINDYTAPVPSEDPLDLYVECDDTWTAANISWSDNCGVEFIIPDVFVSNDGCTWTYHYIWSAWDYCGNFATVDQYVFVSDYTAPYLLQGVPSEITIECDEDQPQYNPIWADNCDDELELSVISGINNVSECGYDIEIVWFAKDDCDNQSSTSMVIHVVDYTAPVATYVPADLTIECDEDVPNSQPVFTDNCDEELTILPASSIAPDGCNYIIHKSWTAVDNCGNETTVTQNIYIIDTTAPVLVGVPADVTVECTAIPAAAIVWAYDNCNDPIMATLSEQIIPQDCGYLIIRTWTAHDPCFNTSSATQVITVTDYTAPVLSGEDVEATFQCNIIPSIIAPTATDNCDDDVLIVPGQVIIPGDCENEYTWVLTWTAYDNCGNSSVRTYIFHFEDTTPPVIYGVPDNTTIECDEEVPNAVVWATDNCDPEVMVSLDAQTYPLDCGYLFVRTWTAVDNCGNTSVAHQTITVVDTTPPALIMPTVNYINETCEEGFLDILLNYNAGVYTPAEVAVVLAQLQSYFVANGLIPLGATDNCDENPTWEEIDIIVETAGLDCPVVGKITCVFQAMDACGNLSATASSYIYVIDEDAPVLFGVPANTTASCDDVPGVAIVTAIDGCYGEVPVTYTFEIIPGEPVMAGGPPCGYTIIRRWTATDYCGNTASATQTIVVYDNEAPILIGVPADVTVECDEIPAPPVVTAEDNCWEGPLEVLLNENIIWLDECTYQLIRTWVVEDNCWNYNSQSQIITVTDYTAPVLSGEDVEATFQCNVIPSIIAPTASDNCDDDVLIVPGQITIPGDCENEYTWVLTWTAYDNCGNSSVRTYIFHFEDTTPPVIYGVPDNTTIECDEEITNAVVWATDNCDPDVMVSLDAQTYPQDCGYLFVRTWTALDNCGNTSVAHQTITVVDTTAPYLVQGVPSEITIECDEDQPQYNPIWADNCDDELELSVISGINNVSECGYDIEIVWFAKDDCDNQSSTSMVIHVVDYTAPVATYVPADLTIECDEDVPNSQPVFTDNCDEELTILPASSIAPDGCNYIIHKSWTAVDNCGNETTVTQNIYIIDTTAPVLVGVPADVTVECTAIPEAAIVWAYDNCNDPITATLSEQIIPQDCGYLIIRTWTAHDPCFNTSSATQVITVTDYTAPILSGEDVEATFQCNVIPSIIAPTASDNCDDDVLIVPGQTIIPGDCENEYTWVLTWTAYDNCGNSSVRTYIFHFEDTTPPVIYGVPDNTTIECDQEITNAVVWATDNCDPDVMVSLDAQTYPQDCGYLFVRTWTAVDNCGNTSVAQQTITVVDYTAPVPSEDPLDLYVECDEEWTAANISWSDNCGVEFIIPDVFVSNDGCTWTYHYIWSAWDYCGNFATVDQYVFVSDYTAPYLLQGVPSEITIECDEDQPQYNPIWADNCDDELELSVISGINNVSECGYDIEIVWFAKDDCDNQSSTSMVIHVVDYTAPVATYVPADLTIECDEDVPNSQPVFTDNCDEELTILPASSIAPDGCNYIIHKSWTAVDNCGNETTVTQNIYIIDTTAPVLVGVPADVTVECTAIPAAAIVWAYDNCNDPIMATLSEQIIPQDCGYLIIRTWTAHDPCFNTSSATQVITVTDYTAPVLSGEDVEATFQCNIIPSIIAPTATDNCDDDVLIVPGQVIIPGDCENEYTWVLTWTAYDNCGNSSVRTYIFHFEDTTPPVIYGVPDNTTIECDEEVPNAVVWATDNCDPEVMVSLDAQTYPQDCGYLFVRTWTAVDNCGNTSVAQQTITVVDYTAPVLHGLPDNVTVECDNVPAATVVTATDNCDPYVPVSYSSWQTEGCPYYIYRTWTASDDCGNTTTHTQTIYVVDTEAPVILNPPTDIEVECDEEVPAYVPQWTDNCDSELELQALSSIGFDDCYTWIHQTYIAIDNCGNQTSVVRNINIVDTTPPVFNPYEPYIQVACGTDIIPCNLTATDNCDDDVTITMTDEVTFSGGCYGNIFRTCTATDECGNTATATQIIYYLDFEAPVLHGVPGDTTVECDDDLPAVPNVTATDNCDDELVVEYDQDIQVITDCITLVIRTWYVIDDCGNEATATQTITINDYTAPVPSEDPLDLYVECDEEWTAANISWSDNCGVEFIIPDVFVSNDGCTWAYHYIWSAWDYCGNFATVDQYVYVTDYTAPYLVQSVPSEITIECDEDQPQYNPIWADNCDEELELSVISGINNVSECSYDIEIVWFAKDDCDNQSSTSMVIHVVDYTAPVATYVPADLTIECDEEVPNSQPVFTDNCDEELTILPASSIAPDGCNYIIHKSWTAVDNCGNETTVTQNIYIIDTTAPVLVGVPADVTVECTAIPEAAIVWAYDNCNDPIMATLSEQIIPQDCGYLIIRTWTAHDPCFNTTSATQVITVTDYTAPVLTGEDVEATFQCNVIPSIIAPTASDNCDDDVLIVPGQITIPGDCENEYTWVLTWTAYDNCGNSSVRTYIFHFEDTTPPVIYGVPDNTTIECDEEITNAVVWATDNCDPEVMVSLDAQTYPQDCGYLFVRTWTAVDNCGNTSVAQQTITVVDYTAPYAISVPEPATYNCDEAIPYSAPAFDDNCDDDLAVVYNGEVYEGDCPYTITRTWTATDDCDNSITVSQVITVIDEEAPVFDPYDIFAFVPCDEFEEFVITAHDNCDLEVDVYVFDDENFSGGCYGNIYRTWIAVDNCGNSTTTTQLIEVVDLIAPEIFNVPADTLVIGCFDAIPPVPADVNATDNCTEDIELIFTEVQSGTSCPYTITYTWTAIDVCGNVTEATYVVCVGEPLPPTTDNNSCPGDFNNDGIVNIQDLLLLTMEFGCMESCGADMNNDGAVNILDFLLFTTEFTKICD